MLTTSSFSVSQMLQVILPTIIALFLFVPFFETANARIDVTTLVLSGIVLGYLVSDIMTDIARRLMKRIPVFRSKLKEYKRQAEFVENNWRISYLEAHLSKEDREVIDIVGYYIIFIQLICFYLTSFFVVNIVLFIVKLSRGLSQPAGATDETGNIGIWRVVTGVNTPVYGRWEVLTIMVIPFSLLAIIYLLYDYLKKFKQSYLPGGLYDTQAEKYQREKGNIATGVWGQVTAVVQENGENVEQPVADLSIWLVKSGEPTVGPTTTDSEGYFQFKNAFVICREGCRTIKVDDSHSMGKPAKHYSVTVASPNSLSVVLPHEKSVPFFPITVTLSEKPA